MKKIKVIKYIGLTLGIALSIFAVSSVIYANWTAPLHSPPTCPSGSPGCDPPVHIGTSSQIKSGSFGVGGVFQANSETHLAVGGGNVGIGTTAPSERLDVEGGTIENLEIGGLLCKAYDDRNQDGTFRGRQIKQWKASTIDFTNINPAGLVDWYTLRCVGHIRPNFSETYTFYVTTDDGARLWINGQEIMNSWKLQAPATHSGTISLTANTWYPIVIEHFEKGGAQRLLLRWSSTSQGNQKVPSSALAFSAHEQAPTIAGTSYFFGNVGIGTTAPGAKLHVAGNIIANDPVAANHVVTKGWVDAQAGGGGGGCIMTFCGCRVAGNENSCYCRPRSCPGGFSDRGENGMFIKGATIDHRSETATWGNVRWCCE